MSQLIDKIKKAVQDVLTEELGGAFQLKDIKINFQVQESFSSISELGPDLIQAHVPINSGNGVKGIMPTKGRKPRNRFAINENSTGRRKGKFSLARKFSISDDDILVIRNFFSKWRKEKRFTQNQLTALEVIGVKKLNSLSVVEREQILSIFNDVREDIAKR